MSQSTRAELYQTLKGAGVGFDKPYNQLKTDELQAAYDELVSIPLPKQVSPQAAGPPPAELDTQQHGSMGGQPVPRQERKVDEMAGERLNTKDEMEPIRTDEAGRIWYQEEVRKPSFAKPRGRRVLKYIDQGVKTETAQNGEFVETFEVAGDRAVASEVKITLPSYQVGIYQDPRFPFKTICYNEKAGFSLFGVQEFYGGEELVPASIKRTYVENMLCYDIPTTIQAIEAEYRRITLEEQRMVQR